MIEVEVHQQLRAFLREQGEPYWPHHLTMARLVARALRLGRSALIQAGPPAGNRGRYRLSYLASALIWPESAILVVPQAVQQRLLMVEIPRLRQWIQAYKPIQTGDRWPHPDFHGLLLVSPEDWLHDRLGAGDRFPENIPTIIDGADDLESWGRDCLTVRITAQDWQALMLAYPEFAPQIRNAQASLTHSIFQHPANPYECCLLDDEAIDHLLNLETQLRSHPSDDFASANSPNCHRPILPAPWEDFWERLSEAVGNLAWVTIDRDRGQFTLHCGPADIAETLTAVWQQQPVVLIGGALDMEGEANIYRQRIGLGDLTCVKFSPDRQNECIQLYVPDRLPMPNTREFQAALLGKMRELLGVSLAIQGLTVLLIDDVPLKAQLASQLAAEFGSRVQVEKTCLEENGILISGGQFWQDHQAVLPSPRLLAIATLPIPSLENPLVAGRVAEYKRQRRDWFRLYLLPEAINQLQRAIAPVRECQGVVALLDNRILHRSYGQQILAALSPLARIDYLDDTLFAENAH